MRDLRRNLLRGAVATATALAGTVIAVGVGAAPAEAATPRCNASGFLPSLRGGQLDMPLYISGTTRTNMCLMSQGDRGDDVSQLQWTLIYCYGKKITNDGIFGSQTKTALIQVQRYEGEYGDGVYGPQTALAMKSPWIPNGGCSYS